MAVGLVYHPVYLEHDTGHHPERASRLVEIKAALERDGLWPRLHHLSPRPATEPELLEAHSQEHIRWVKSQAQQGGGWVDMDTILSAGSYQAALYAAGGAIVAAEAVLKGDVSQALALVRPPGHHATRDQAMGFCLINNMAVAIHALLAGGTAQRIFIFDFDAHHGNGTEAAFYSDPRVFFFSMHQHPLYPGTGHADHMGDGEGRGTTINVPLPPECGDEEFRQVCGLMAQAVRRFRPDIILVSAGYDGHWLDGISQLQLSVSGYAQTAETIRGVAGEVCGGKAVFLLEGGYHAAALSTSVVATCRVLLGEEWVDLLGPPMPYSPPDISPLLHGLRHIHELDEAEGS
ncbi:MAG: histone deacetylase [Dehalococcoidia bacterium]|jgi:acetoin utilization deacetylase AcuC-like enzyme|nr:histone deacetylase [Dehalococcoidia bacterium]MDP7239875.1 histone deacetylase [Dehalococcoidia bacterium]